eukprot:tig00021178_g19209.t1
MGASFGSQGGLAAFWSKYAEGADLQKDPHVARASDGKTPLAYAASIGDVDACRLLLDRGAQSRFLITAPDSAGRTPLWHAASGGHAAVLRLLIGRGAPPTDYGAEPCALYKAASTGDADALKRLLAGRQGFDDELPYRSQAAWPTRSYAGVVLAAARAGSLVLTRLLLDSWPAPLPAAEDEDERRKKGAWSCPQHERDTVIFAGAYHPLAHVAAFCAAESGSVELVRYLLERKPKKPPRAEGEEEEEEEEEEAPKEGPGGLLVSKRPLPLHGAAGAGRLEVLRFLVEERKEPVRVLARQLGTPLNLAARYGHLEAVRYLLDRGAGARDGEPPADREGEDEDRGRGSDGPWPSLLEAAAGGHAEVIELLLDRGADANARGVISRERSELEPASALELAAERGHAACVQLLAKRGADVAGRGPYAALLAASEGHVDVLKVLAALGVSLVAPLRADKAAPKQQNNRNQARGAGQGGAGRGGRRAAPKAAHAGPQRGARGGRAAIHAAAGSARPACVRALLEMGVPPSLPSKPVGGAGAGFTPLHLAASCDKEVLGLGRGSPPEGDEPLHAAARALLESDVLETVRVLLDAGADLEAKDGDRGNTPLLAALSHGAPDAVVLELLARGASVHAANKGAWQALNLASRSSSGAVVRAILERKPDLGNCPRNEGDDASDAPGPPTQTALRNPAAMKELLAAGAPTDGLLAQAFLYKCDDETIRVLLDAGADPNEAIYWGSPLHLACGCGPYDGTGYSDRMYCKARPLPIVQLLLDKGADVNMEVLDLGTPLAWAVLTAGGAKKEEDLATVRLLLQRGAKVDCVRKRNSANAPPGGEPLHEACGHYEGSALLVDALLQAGASLDAQNEEGMPPLGAARSVSIRSHLIRLETEAYSKGGLPRPPVLRGVPQRAKELSMHRNLHRDPRLYGKAGGFLKAAAGVAKDGLLEELRACLDLALHCEGTFWTGDFAPALGAASGPRGGAMRALVNGALRVLSLEGRLALRKFRGRNMRLSGEEDDGGEEDPEGAQGAAPEEGETALHAACRHGFRLAALRLAEAAPASALDAADGKERTPLLNAVSHGPAMLDVCVRLMQRGADPARTIGQGPNRKMVVQAHPDVTFQAALKRAGGLRDAFFSHAPEDASFARRLLQGLEAAHVTCALDDATEADEAAGLRKAQALIFVVSAAGAASARCRAQLAAARRLGRPVYPVWREKCALDDQLQGALMKQQFADLSTDALFASGLPPFALTLAQRLATGGAGGTSAAGQQEALAQAAAALLASPGARCALADPAPFLFVWCHAAVRAPQHSSPRLKLLLSEGARGQDAAFAGQFVRGLAHRGRRCWLECSGGGAQRPQSAGGAASGDEGTQAVVKCAAFVPLLSPAALADPLLRDRFQLAELNKRPLKPVVVSELQVLEGLFPDAEPYVYITKGNVALLSNLEALVQSLPSLAASAAASAAAAAAPRPASAGRAAPGAAAGQLPAASDIPALERAAAERRERLARARRRAEELRAAAAAGGGAGGSKACSIS